jgi:hypothetical protein
MKTLTLLISFALAQVFAASAGAQPVSAESYPPGSAVPAPRVKPTPDDKVQGKALRRQTGAVAAKDSAPDEGNPIPDAKAKVARAERKTARAERKAESRRANKAGEITSKGETGIAK